MEGSSKVQRQFITKRAQRYLSNSTACSILSLHSVSKLFFCSCKHNMNLHGLSKQDKTQEQRNGSHCIFLAFSTNYKNNAQSEDHVHHDLASATQPFVRCSWNPTDAFFTKGYRANVSFMKTGSVRGILFTWAYIHLYLHFQHLLSSLSKIQNKRPAHNAAEQMRVS